LEVERAHMQEAMAALREEGPYRRDGEA
jgi:hypothetical protein